VEVCKGRCAVVAGSGSNCTRESISQTRDVKAWGADAAMLISPYYNKPQQAGLLAHYRAIARAVDIPQVIYNVPGRTAVNILPETVAQLAAEPNVVALKEASGNLAQIEDAIARCDLKVYSGDDGLNFSIYGLGGRRRDQRREQPAAGHADPHVEGVRRRRPQPRLAAERAASTRSATPASWRRTRCR
jgi:4-hydroxy-tetrahydrodipicolinate synthase